AEMAKTRAIQAIEQKLGEIDPDSGRGQVLALAHRFKSDWVELGERLAAVLGDGLYRDWGFTTFERYVTSELCIKKENELKLVRSYGFVQKAKPEYLTPERRAELPVIDTIDFLARAEERDDAPPPRA